MTVSALARITVAARVQLAVKAFQNKASGEFGKAFPAAGCSPR